jgi:hypothetical protein
MTNEEFDRKLLTVKLPFRVEEAARQMLVHGHTKEVVIRSCNIQKTRDLMLLDIALTEISS